MAPPQLTVALAGNPNAGKTTLFNALTGQRQHVGNYPGVTVAKKEGWLTHAGREHHVVDLPGTYSLTAYSLEERLARDVLMQQSPDAVIDVIDASNLERNLYLAVQLMEMGVPLVLAFNKSDLAAARGYRIDVKLLSDLLGVPIVPTVGHKGKGVRELIAAAAAVAANPDAAVARQRPVHYGRELEPELARLTELAAGNCGGTGKARWIAVKLLEDDEHMKQRLGAALSADDLRALLAAAGESRRHLRQVGGDAAEILLADGRYGFISGACQEAVRSTVEARHQFSDRVDAVVTNRYLGLPLLLVLTLVFFQAAFWVGMPVSKALDGGKELLAQQVSQLWAKGSDSLLRSLLVSGVIQGVGAVVVFVPMVFFVFLAIAVLEDSGYMARAAFVMDRVMHKIGLHGKSVVPMLIGFGCTVPGLLATRTLESRRDRLTTMLVLPLCSCSARLPIYALILGAFFPERRVFSLFGVANVTNQALILTGMYLIGIVLAVVAAKVLRSTLLRGEATSFVMELPPYRLPTLRGALVHTWERTWLFLRKAGTVILAAVVVLWALSSFPRAADDPALSAERDRADRRLLQAADAVAPQAGPRENVLRFLRARMELAAAARLHWPASEAFAAARAEYDRQAGALAAADPRTRLLLQDFARHERRRGQAASAPAPAGSAAALLASAERRWLHDLRDIDNRRARQRLEHSVVGRVGRTIEPALKPCGFDWRIGTSLIGAFAAKEVFVGQMGVMYALGETEAESERLWRRLQEQYTPLQGFCIMLFCLISMPCIATVAVTWRESGAIRWALLMMGYLTVLAWVVTAAVYQVGSALGVGAAG